MTTAQRLAIHRNTVIYRLDKISRLTARDVREPQVAIAAYLACLINRLTFAADGRTGLRDPGHSKRKSAPHLKRPRASRFLPTTAQLLPPELNL